MKIVLTDEKSLAALGAEAAGMLARRDYAALASRFGYALCFGRDPAAALQADHLAAAASSHQTEKREPIAVKYFPPNSAGLFAVVECLVPAADGAAVLMELVVSGQEEKQIIIEDISGAVG
ncbi:hypothetical protein [Solimonas variicoloris]|uniref:hypothetical protein n=1 Tax=Solimonas variicoloris TaxID=254408 RepID=UPI00036BEC52|nr:hypothetical protein [Solimonas variicoloris]